VTAPGAAPRDTFERQQYVVARSIVAEPLLGFLWRYVQQAVALGTIADTAAQVPGTPAGYGDLVMEHLLERLRPQAQAISGLDLYPTYSYVRLYKRGDVLAAHHDRPSCEVSFSMTLGQEPDEPWPLWIRGSDGPAAVLLRPGDAVLYRGIDCEHWRERYEGVRLAQVFLHYVDQHGPHVSWRFDRRDGLALTHPLPI
jgi:hypothetical protein